MSYQATTQDQEALNAFLAQRVEADGLYKTSDIAGKASLLLEKIESDNTLWKLWAVEKVFPQNKEDKFSQVMFFEIVGKIKECLLNDPTLWTNTVFGVLCDEKHLLSYFWKKVNNEWQKSFNIAKLTQDNNLSDHLLLDIWRHLLSNPKVKKEELRYFFESKTVSPVLPYFVSMLTSLDGENSEVYMDALDVMLQADPSKLWATHFGSASDQFLINQKAIPFGNFQYWKSLTPIVGLQQQKESDLSFDVFVMTMDTILKTHPYMKVSSLTLKLIEDVKHRELVKIKTPIKDHLLDGLLEECNQPTYHLFWQEVPKAICQATVPYPSEQNIKHSSFVFCFGVFLLKEHLFWKNRLECLLKNKQHPSPKQMDDLFASVLDVISLSQTPKRQKNLMAALALTDMMSLKWNTRTIVKENEDDLKKELCLDATNKFSNIMFDLTGMSSQLFLEIVYSQKDLTEGNVLDILPATLLKILQWEEMDIEEFKQKWSNQMVEVEGYLSSLVDKTPYTPVKESTHSSIYGWLDAYQATVLKEVEKLENDLEEGGNTQATILEETQSSLKDTQEEKEKEKEEITLPTWEVVSDQDKLLAAFKKWKNNKEGDHNYLVDAHNEGRFASRSLQVITNLSVFDELDVMFPQFHEAINHYRIFATLQSQGNKAFYAPPLLLDGPPGIGKTYFALQLAKALQVSFFPLSIPNIAGSFEMVGSSSQWQGGRGGFILDTLLESPFANPLILFDEIDKIPQSNYPVGPTLLNLLESHTAQHFTDQFAQVPFDIRPFVYLATSNRCQAMPEPLISRFHVIKMGLPTFSDRVALVKGVYQKSLKEYSWGAGMKDLPQESLQFLAQTSGSARDLNRRLMRAIACAIQDNRFEVLPSDIEGVVLNKNPWDLPLEECQKLFELSKSSHSLLEKTS